MEQTKLDKLQESYTQLLKDTYTFMELHNFKNFKPNIGVFGENSTGKSTFLNTIVGNKEEFKMGYGETTNQVSILYKNEKPILDNHIEYHYVQANYSQLEYFNLFDIPGYGKEYSQKNLELILEKLDIVLWLIDASTGIKKSDIDFLHKISQFNTKVIIIYNRIDSISHEIYNYKEITNDINQIKHQFKNHNLENNLIGIFPYSATKSLVSIVKKEQGTFSTINETIQLILHYSAFSKSFDRYSTYLLSNINNYKGQLEKKDIIQKLNSLTEEITNNLEQKLQNNISCWSSLNPFSSKNEEAKKYVNDSIKELRIVSQKWNDVNIQKFNQIINQFQTALTEYKVFNNHSLSIPLPLSEKVNLHIDLNDLAWDSFWGDSFAKDVSYQFRRKSKIAIDSQVQSNYLSFNKYIMETKKILYKSIGNYSINFDKRLQNISLDMEELISYLIVKELIKQDKK